MGRAGFTPPPPVGRVNGGVNPALRRKGEVGLWQPRFWEHHIRDEQDYANHVRYCWINPVKHGLVERAVDWPYSSIHRDIGRGIVEPVDDFRVSNPACETTRLTSKFTAQPDAHLREEHPRNPLLAVYVHRKFCSSSPGQWSPDG